MVKKIIAGVLAALVLVLAGFKLFYHKDSTPKKIAEVRENLTYNPPRRILKSTRTTISGIFT